MKVAVVRVRFSRQVNDGNYGSETISIERELVAEEYDGTGILPNDIAAQLHNCRLQVETELGQSPNWSVRRGVEYPTGPEMQQAMDDDEDLPL